MSFKSINLYQNFVKQKNAERVVRIQQESDKKLQAALKLIEEALGDKAKASQINWFNQY